MTELNPYAKAASVELYAAGVIIRRGGFDSPAGFHEFAFPGYELHGEALRKLLQVLGVEAGAFTEQTAQGPKNRSIAYLDLVLDRHTVWYGDQDNLAIADLEVRVLGAQLLLLRISVKTEDGVTWTTEHTYSGPFSVEWELEIADAA